MEESKILTTYVALENHVHDIVKTSDGPAKKTIAAIQTHLAKVKAACMGASTSFNASEQIQDLHHAQKELDLMLQDFLTLQEAGQITQVQHVLLQHYVHDCDEVIRNMSDPEFS